jgi:multiple sugar transport system ATP-binding protein
VGQIEFRALRKEFPGAAVAVEGVDLVIPDGEFLVLVGPSGSGKTTVLRMAAGLERPSDGQVLIGDDIVNDLTPMERNVAMVFQSYALYPHMTVYANMAFGLKLHKVGKGEIDARVRSTAEMLGIESLLGRKPAQLSGGQRQRVAMGRAIVREPDAFLMDEPLSNLDAKLRVEMRAYLATLHQRLRTTTLYVTHDQTEAMTMGDRVAVMRDGRLQQVDRPQVLYEHPANLFVAGFIGSPAMNLLRGRLIRDGETLAVALGATRLPLPVALHARRPQLVDYTDRDVIVGIRPEDIEDAAFAPSANGATLSTEVRLAEPMGAEVIAHFSIAAPSAAGHASVLAARDADTPMLGAGDGAAIVTARLNPRTDARSGSPLRVAIDLERMHFFDPETEAAIR